MFFFNCKASFLRPDQCFAIIQILQIFKSEGTDFPGDQRMSCGQALAPFISGRNSSLTTIPQPHPGSIIVCDLDSMRVALVAAIVAASLAEHRRTDCLPDVVLPKNRSHNGLYPNKTQRRQRLNSFYSRVRRPSIATSS